MLIKEVILENFMSYEYARIPLKGGVNVVCGPNGSGKSSFLLGICVALGDTYTERSKKLSDLIRWNQDQARVTLILDNSREDRGYRPIPRLDLDEIRLTRTLRRDGKYGFQLNNRGVTKGEVVELLANFGFDPDNMLIIMHQNMPGRFANLSPKERLVMLEEAVGYDSYRRDVIEAKRKLSGILSEEDSLNQLLNQARETLDHWREQNERLQEKRQYQRRMNFLQREMAWSRVINLEGALERLQEELERADRDLYEAEQEMDSSTRQVIESESALKSLRASYSDLIEQRIHYERILGISEASITNAKDQIANISRMIESSSHQRRAFEERAQALKQRLSAGPTTLDQYFNLFSEIEKTQQENYDTWSEELQNQRSSYERRMQSLIRQLSDAEEMVGKVTEKMQVTRIKLEDTNSRYVEGRVQLALLKDRRGRLRGRIEDLKKELSRTSQDLRDSEAEALVRGSRVDTGRTSDEILSEIRKTSGILLSLNDVPENAEDMYERYNETFKEIQGRVEQVKENRRRVLAEIEERTHRWRDITQNLLLEVNKRYQNLLSMLQAKGWVELTNAHDIEEAGLEIFVGFKGAQPSRLDPYTHSGGERSTSIISFLLSMQQNVLSPFRAIDEFDLHMDPKNKEIVSDFIVQTMEGSKDQYMAITPSQVTFRGKDIHIVMVHKTENTSAVDILEE